MLNEAVLLEQNKRLREENEELRETIRQMRSLSAESADLEPLPAGVPHLTRSEETILRALLTRRRTVPRETLYNEVYDEDGPDIKMIDVWVFKLRRKLVGTGIVIRNDYGRGYYIERPEIAAAETRGAVVDMISEAVAA